MMEALRLTASGIIDEVQGIKTTQSGLLERIVAVEARLQNALVGVNKNFVSMSQGRLAPFRSPSIKMLTQRCYRSTGLRICMRVKERR